MIDPAWEGKVQFYELVFGTWLIYIFLVLMWERVLRAKKAEWIYVLITFLGASFFWINHYLQHAPFYSWLLNGYTLVFFIIYYAICVHHEARSIAWKIAATLSTIVFTVAFILFENIARYLVDDRGVNEFWVMLIAYFGFIGLIGWRSKANH
ncbi:MAG TPA: hypothetical protein QF499_02090 [Gammaproteobacteria bacterium]|jgi:hypothetical protein|nr:hypothetical protein [Chromatiales bacterium]MCP4924528.1 hypothetical protein [Gammaproteobacteria bacterium]MDP7154533.1 hypothetical protein [Gammaproteobacteria bacterium]MDP7297002.1 hypothetical protein [Gammaproteobacteria bacterium]MDP7661140.1 hypothetical protein [Gammaproteobacteria bacterium]